MAVKGLSSLERETIFSKDDPSVVGDDVAASIANGATPFMLKNIPSNVQAHINDMSTAQQLNLADGGTQTLVNRKSRKNREAFKWGIGGWDNFYTEEKDAEGNVTQVPIVYEVERTMLEGRSYEVVAERCLDKVPLALINEIGEEAFNRNTLTEPQRKKLGELSSLFAGGDTTTAVNARKTKDKVAGAKGARTRTSGGKTSEKSTKKPAG